MSSPVAAPSQRKPQTRALSAVEVPSQSKAIAALLAPVPVQNRMSSIEVTDATAGAAVITQNRTAESVLVFMGCSRPRLV